MSEKENANDFKVVRFKLNRFMWKKLNDESKKTGLTMSQLVRSLLYERYVTRNVRDF